MRTLVSSFFLRGMLSGSCMVWNGITRWGLVFLRGGIESYGCLVMAVLWGICAELGLGAPGAGVVVADGWTC